MTDNSTSNKPWGGRFTESTDAFVEAFTASVDFDRRLYRQDIAGSVAHARMLEKIGLENGLKDMADWAQSVGARESSVFSNIEIREKLPSIWETHETNG